MSLRLTNFNSIKVRLKQDVVQRLLADSEFQFHKGTIKTFFGSLLGGIANIFQFHKGTIKTFALAIFYSSSYISIP